MNATDSEKPISPHMSKACLKLHDDVSSALQSAMMIAASTGGRAYPCSVFEQGGRVLIATSFPMSTLKSMLVATPATKGVDPRKAGNRPVNPMHVRAIRDYLVKNKSAYVLGPLSISYRQTVQVYTTRAGFARQGYLVIPDGLYAHITDGQHRYYAIVGYDGKPKISGAIDEASELLEDGVAVQMTIENDLRRVHQDFADMALTKALPKSLLTAYDLRDPVNRLAYEIVEKTPLLKNRVDETSKSLSKGSRYVALSNWLRGLITGVIAPNYFIPEAEIPKWVREELPSEEQVDELRDDLLHMFESMTRNVPALKEIAELNPLTPAANKVAGLRSQVLATTAVGLGISGMVLKAIRTQVRDRDKRLEYINRLYEEVRWIREGEVDTVWKDGGVLTNGSISSLRRPVFTSTVRIIQRLGLEIPSNMKNYVT